MPALRVTWVVVAILHLLNATVYSTCCQFLYNAAELIACVNRTRTIDVTAVNHAQVITGPTLQVVLITRATHNTFAYAGYAYLLQSAYADHNGYQLQALTPDSTAVDYAYHRKLVPLLEAFQEAAVATDYLVWMDAGSARDLLTSCSGSLVFITCRLDHAGHEIPDRSNRSPVSEGSHPDVWRRQFHCEHGLHNCAQHTVGTQILAEMAGTARRCSHGTIRV
jgi:hypothetical protein